MRSYDRTMIFNTYDVFNGSAVYGARVGVGPFQYSFDVTTSE